MCIMYNNSFFYFLYKDLHRYYVYKIYTIVDAVAEIDVPLWFYHCAYSTYYSL